ncbi:MAG: PfkB family carbohydrate kinase [Clostridiales bacterium]|nr:PfkB family carbohydrate kinase [Clostridiales bacterium]
MERVSISPQTVRETLEKIKDLRVCVLGDISLDLYWVADMTRSRLSRETPHHPLPVVREYGSLGGGGNVIANIAALCVQKIVPVSVIGEDWRGSVLSKELEAVNVSKDFIFTCGERVTPAYCKPVRSGISPVRYEDPRIDFENREPLPPEYVKRIIDALYSAAGECDAIAVCDQLEYGIVSHEVRQALSELGRRGKRVIVDSRDRVRHFTDVIVKPNEVEAAAALGLDTPNGDAALRVYGEMALALALKTGCPAVVTIGERGSLWAEDGAVRLAPALKVPGPFDFVGAGDTFLSGFACALGAGLSGPDALSFANIAASVTIQKLGTTGVATPAEMIRQSEAFA